MGISLSFSSPGHTRWAPNGPLGLLYRHSVLQLASHSDSAELQLPHTLLYYLSQVLTSTPSCCLLPQDSDW